MRAGGLMTVAAAALLAAAACSSDDGTGPVQVGLADLVGTYSLSRWTYARADQPESTADWVDLLDLSGSLHLTSNGAFTVAPALPGGFGSDEGVLSVDGDSIYWDGNNDEEWVRFRLEGDVLTLTWPEVEVVDMDRDGEPEEVRLEVKFVK